MYSAAREVYLGAAKVYLGAAAARALRHSIVDQIVKSPPVLESSGGRLNDEPSFRVDAK